MSIYREPVEESTALYPGLVVHDGRVTGSITAGATRLPLWAFAPAVVDRGWKEADLDYGIVDTGLTRDAFAEFLYHLLELRGEFGRLLLVLANAARLDGERVSAPVDMRHDIRPWWEVPGERELVLAQLRRCVAALAEVGEDEE